MLLTTGVVTSPNYPDFYPDNLELTETVEVEEGLVLSLEFYAFNIEAEYDYDYATYEYDYDSLIGCYDHLTIMDGDGTTLMEKRCGSSLPNAIRSRSNTVKLIFSTDTDYTESGWGLSWTAVTSGECQHGFKYLDNLSASCSLIFDIIVDYFLSITELHKQLWCFFFFSASLFFSSHP